MNTTGDSLLLKNARIIDGIGGYEPSLSCVRVRDGLIDQISFGSVLEPLDDELCIDLKGYWLLPGLIDCHAHLAAVEYELEKRLTTPASLSHFRTAKNLKRTLDAGYTTVREAGGIDLGIKRALEEDLIPGPRLLVSLAIVTQTGGLWDLHLGAGAHLDLSGIQPEVVRYSRRSGDLIDMARQLLHEGADLLNIHTSSSLHKSPKDPLRPMFTESEISAFVAEAHRAGKRVMAHVDGGPGVANAIRSGCDTIEHPYQLSDEDIDLLLNHDCWLVPTLSCNAGILKTVAEDPDAGVHASAQLAAEQILAVHQEGFRRALAAGVKIAAGSDSYGHFQGENAWELSLMVEQGMSAMGALVAATGDAAKCLGLEHHIGSIGVGKCADLIAIKDSPLSDIQVLRNPAKIALILQQGRVYKSLFPTVY